MTFSNPTLVFAERHVELPVAAVFDAPMISYCTCKRVTRKHLADDVVSHGDLVALAALCVVDRHADRFEILPPIAIGKIVRDLTQVVAAFINATMIRLFGVMLKKVDSYKVIFQMIQEERFDSFVKCGLISLDRQAVVRTFVDDLLGDFSLATHRVDGHQTAGNIDDFKQFRDCRDFVALLVNDRLPKAGVVVASAKCLAVNCDDLSIGDPVQFSEPSQQNWFELVRLHRVENGIETIMRRNALGHVQELGKLLLLCVCKPCDCNKIIRSRDDSADHHEQHIDQRINRFAETRIGDVSKLSNKRSRTFHRNMPWRNVSPSRCDSAAQTRNFTQCPRLPSVAESPWSEAVGRTEAALRSANSVGVK